VTHSINISPYGACPIMLGPLSINISSLRAKVVYPRWVRDTKARYRVTIGASEDSE